MTDADERLDGISVSSAPAPGPARAPRGASVFTSASNLANCAVGAGILSLPYAVRETASRSSASSSAPSSRSSSCSPSASSFARRTSMAR